MNEQRSRVYSNDDSARRPCLNPITMLRAIIPWSCWHCTYNYTDTVQQIGRTDFRNASRGFQHCTISQRKHSQQHSNPRLQSIDYCVAGETTYDGRRNLEITTWWWGSRRRPHKALHANATRSKFQAKHQNSLSIWKAKKWIMEWFCSMESTFLKVSSVNDIQYFNLVENSLVEHTVISEYWNRISLISPLYDA